MGVAKSRGCSTVGPVCSDSVGRSTSGCCTNGSASVTRHAQLAYDVYIHRLRKYVGGYLALLGYADVIAFTAGVGENDAKVRRDALTGLSSAGDRTR